MEKYNENSIIKSNIRALFELGINKENVYLLIRRLLDEKENELKKTKIDNKVYIKTDNVFESDLMLWKRAEKNTYHFDKYLKEVK